MDSQANAVFFDSIAHQWDGWENLPELRRKLALGLGNLNICPSETLLDIGCGTGNIVLGLLGQLSPHGRVVAIDVSSRMIEIARKKIPDSRITWSIANAFQLPLANNSIDRTFCCSVWPHFDDPPAISREIFRVLRSGGFMHIWHFQSRAQINQIHAEAGPAVNKDVLAPATETATVLGQAGFQIMGMLDNEQGYLVTAFKPPQR